MATCDACASKCRKDIALDALLNLLHEFHNPNNPFALPMCEASKVGAGYRNATRLKQLGILYDEVPY